MLYIKYIESVLLPHLRNNGTCQESPSFLGHHENRTANLLISSFKKKSKKKTLNLLTLIRGCVVALRERAETKQTMGVIER